MSQREKQQHVSSLLELLALRPRIVHGGPGMGNRPPHSAKGAGQETLPQAKDSSKSTTRMPGSVSPR